MDATVIGIPRCKFHGLHCKAVTKRVFDRLGSSVRDRCRLITSAIAFTTKQLFTVISVSTFIFRFQPWLQLVQYLLHIVVMGPCQWTTPTELVYLNMVARSEVRPAGHAQPEEIVKGTATTVALAANVR